MQQVEKMPLFSLLLITDSTACFRFEDFFSCRLKLVPLYAESHISPLFAKLDALDPSPASREEIRYGYDLPVGTMYHPDGRRSHLQYIGYRYLGYVPTTEYSTSTYGTTACTW
jgi:hypothetical protein